MLRINTEARNRPLWGFATHRKANTPSEARAERLGGTEKGSRCLTAGGNRNSESLSLCDKINTEAERNRGAEVLTGLTRLTGLGENYVSVSKRRNCVVKYT